MKKRLTPEDILEKKRQGRRLTMLTAYDYAFAQLIDSCGIDMILVGDSLANVVLGLGSTRDVDIDIMLHHAKAVNRGVSKALLIGDLPYSSCHAAPGQTVKDARRFLDEAGCDAVKIEWFENCAPSVEALRQAQIPVMGHVGLTPQTAEQLGGFKVQGKGAEKAQQILTQARWLEDKGCFGVVLECVPDRLAQIITGQLTIPTIGIGAGPYCDGQVLVTHDALGLFESYQPKFVKTFMSAGSLIQKAVKEFQDEVVNGTYPDDQHSYHMPDEEFAKLQKG